MQEEIDRQLKKIHSFQVSFFICLILFLGGVLTGLVFWKDIAMLAVIFIFGLITNLLLAGYTSGLVCPKCNKEFFGKKGLVSIVGANCKNCGISFKSKP